MEPIPRNTFQKQYKEIRTTYIVLKYFFEEKHCDKCCIHSDLCLYWCFVSDLSQFHICNLKEIIVMKLLGFQSCHTWTWTYNDCLHVNSKLAEGRQKEKRKKNVRSPRLWRENSDFKNEIALASSLSPCQHHRLPAARFKSPTRLHYFPVLRHGLTSLLT